MLSLSVLAGSCNTYTLGPRVHQALQVLLECVGGPAGFLDWDWNLWLNAKKEINKILLDDIHKTIKVFVIFFPFSSKFNHALCPTIQIWLGI